MRLHLTALVAAGLATSGCVEEDAAMFIEGVLPVEAGVCQVSANGQIFDDSGTLDLNANRGYSAALKVRTNLPATFNAQDVAQSRTQSPNYPNYGGVDNNVVIFETAEVTFTLQSDAATIGALSAAASQVNGANLVCSATACGSPTDAVGGAIPDIVPAGGTAFNQQTGLNGQALVSADILSGATAQTLKAVYQKAAELEAANLEARTLLDVPGETQRLTVEVVLVGRTTGSQGLRLVRSAAFPFAVDVCLGCLKPDEALCDKFNADLFVADGAEDACFEGQDFATAVCGCDDGAGGLTVVDDDRTACTP